MSLRKWITTLWDRVLGQSAAPGSLRPTRHGARRHDAPPVPQASNRASTATGPDTVPAHPVLTLWSTQYPRRTSDDILDAIVGFDLGTSCSKVVIRTPFMPGR